MLYFMYIILIHFLYIIQQELFGLLAALIHPCELLLIARKVLESHTHTRTFSVHLFIIHFVLFFVFFYTVCCNTNFHPLTCTNTQTHTLNVQYINIFFYYMLKLLVKW